MRDQGTGGLDREQVRQVFVSIGRPLPAQPLSLVGIVGLVPRRTLMLAALLGLVIALALSPAARGAEAARGTVQKGLGGGASASDNPLREIENFSDHGASPLYNFLQNFQIASSPAPVRAPLILREPQESVEPQPLSEPPKLMTALALISLVILWMPLRSPRGAHPAPRRRRPR